MTNNVERIQRSRIMLLFTPGLVAGVNSEVGSESDAEIGVALGTLDSALKARDGSGVRVIDVVQLRIKDNARNLHTWALRLVDRFAGMANPPLLLINDRVDVAMSLGSVEGGIAGVHLGQGDLPIADARRLLGPNAVIGRSTHDFAQVIMATEEGANYLGFGPIHATETKGYERGIGTDQAWIASAATGLALFPIGGINAGNASELNEVGRAAISSAILGAEGPEQATLAIAAGLA